MTKSHFLSFFFLLLLLVVLLLWLPLLLFCLWNETDQAGALWSRMGHMSQLAYGKQGRAVTLMGLCMELQSSELQSSGHPDLSTNTVKSYMIPHMTSKQ